MFITYLPVIMGFVILALATAAFALLVKQLVKVVRWVRVRAVALSVEKMIAVNLPQKRLKASSIPASTVAVATVGAIVVPGIRQVDWCVYDSPAYVRAGRAF